MSSDPIQGRLEEMFAFQLESHMESLESEEDLPGLGQGLTTQPQSGQTLEIVDESLSEHLQCTKVHGKHS